MLRPHVLLSAILFGFAALAAYGQDAKLKVEIKAAKISVKNNALFSVSTLIRNTNGEEQSVVVRGCGSRPYRHILARQRRAHFSSVLGVRSDGYRVSPSDDRQRNEGKWPRPFGLR